MNKAYTFRADKGNYQQPTAHSLRSNSRTSPGSHVGSQNNTSVSMNYPTFSQSYRSNLNLSTNVMFSQGIDHAVSSRLGETMPFNSQTSSSTASYPLYDSTNPVFSDYQQVDHLRRRYSARSSGVIDQDNYIPMDSHPDYYNPDYPTYSQQYSPLLRSCSFQFTPPSDSPSSPSQDDYYSQANYPYATVSPAYYQFVNEMDSRHPAAFSYPSNFGSASFYYSNMNDSHAFQGNRSHALSRRFSLEKTSHIPPFSYPHELDWYDDTTTPSRSDVFSSNRGSEYHMLPYLYESGDLLSSQPSFTPAESYSMDIQAMEPMNESYMQPMESIERKDRMNRMGNIDNKDSMKRMNSVEHMESPEPVESIEPVEHIEYTESIEPIDQSERVNRVNRSNRSGRSDRYHVHVVLKVLQHPFYASLWSSRARDHEGRGILYSKALKACSAVPPRNLLASLIKECIRYKKLCRLASTRVLFLELLCDYYHIVQIWLEFSRMEVESGEHRHAQFLLQCALELYPHNVLIISKLVRIDERLQDLDEILTISNTLIEMNSQKAFRILIDIIVSLAKLGDETAAFHFVDFLLCSPQLCSRWLLHEILRFLVNASSCNYVQSLIFQWMKRLPKHGPLWMFCHEYIEYLTSSENPLSISSTEIDSYTQLTTWAAQALSPDTLWKVFLTRMQRIVRTVLRCYIKAHLQGVWTDDLHAVMENEITQLQIETKKCLQLCPPPQKWKVFAVLGKSFAILGFPCKARLVMQHSLHFCQEKCSHVLLLELARTEFFCYRATESVFILKQATLRFVDEWKLGLELMNELVMTNRQLEALHLCRNLLKLQFGAGRLWAMFIHMIHEMFGPEEALRYFHEALHHVAKSGEIWCEGARIFLDPTSPHFNPQNARIALNYSVFLTPQYGDSFIEGIRLLMITSNVFLTFHWCTADLLTYLLQAIPELSSYLRRCSFFVPNYGPLWYRCRERWLCPGMEVMIDAVIGCARAVARDANLYFSALSNLAHQKQGKGRLYRSRFSYAFLPDYDFMEEYVSSNISHRIKSLLGSLPLDN